ncbi:hypothetical protein, partial [Liquorilactobacillus satsumensis]
NKEGMVTLLDFEFIKEFLYFISCSSLQDGPSEKEVLAFALSKGISKHELGYIEILLYEAQFTTKKPLQIEGHFVSLSPGKITAIGQKSVNSDSHNVISL